MNERPPVLPATSRGSRLKLSPKFLIVWAASASLIVLALGVCSVLLLLRPKPQDVQGGEPARQIVPFAEAGSGNDFAASNSVTIGLGERESDGGIRHIAREGDGLTAIGMVQGSPCRHFNFPERPGRPWQIGFFYFALDPSFKQNPEDVKSVMIEVEYCSESRGRFSLQYDAIGSPKTLQSSFARARPEVRLDGSKEWKKASFHIRDGAFENSENGHSDFRIEVVPPDISIRRVTVTREKE